MHHLCRDPLREALAFTSVSSTCQAQVRFFALPRIKPHAPLLVDRKSTRLNSSHSQISYAVFCLKKKKHNIIITSLDFLQRIIYSHSLWLQPKAGCHYKQFETHYAPLHILSTLAANARLTQEYE